MDAKLIIVGGKANKSEIGLKLPTIIGRSRDADLTMAHPMVSRQHCELYEVGGLLKIRDLGSLNGTFVGGEKIQDADLYPDTEFTVGPLTFRVAYAYLGEIASPPLSGPGKAPPKPADAAVDFLEIAQEPSDGELPDFDAWAASDSGQAEQPTGPRGLDLPPPPPGFAEVALADAETERPGRPEEESDTDAPPVAPEPDENKPTPPADGLNDFYKGLK